MKNDADPAVSQTLLGLLKVVCAVVCLVGAAVAVSLVGLCN